MPDIIDMRPVGLKEVNEEEEDGGGREKSDGVRTASALAWVASADGVDMRGIVDED
jgi:hypothetical protein